MNKIQLSDFQIIPIVSSVKRLKISDDVYFKKYADCVSNSRLKHINQYEGGNFQQYIENPPFSSQSLAIGSAIHELLLQPESFELAPKMNRPTAKLGEVIDAVHRYRCNGDSIYDSISKACRNVGYYVNQIDSKIPFIIKSGLEYYKVKSQYTSNSGKEGIFLADKDWDIVDSCLKSCLSNTNFINKLHPRDGFMEPLPTFNEDAIFLDVLVTYKDKYTILKLKMKADNWTIDEENKIVTLNDLKTSSKPVAWFMNKEYGSFYHYHYYRQFAFYFLLLQTYCIKEYGYNYKWKMNGNVLVVNTKEFESGVYSVNKYQIEQGRKEYERLLKQVAYLQIFGDSEEVEFV